MALAMGQEAGTGLALDMAPVERMVEVMEAVEVVEVAAAPVGEMEVEVDRATDPAVAQGTARVVVPKEVVTEAVAVVAAAPALGLAMVLAMGQGTGVEVVDTLNSWICNRPLEAPPCRTPRAESLNLSFVFVYFGYRYCCNKKMEGLRSLN